MQESVQQISIQEITQLRNSKIEALYERLMQVTDHYEKNEILRELELLTGVKLMY
ncbi:MAG: hypothetical protein AAGG02_20460 [Cyanobacteria bacterium P01_H01_bin.15]|mgnify:CR=1 FL=1